MLFYESHFKGASAGNQAIINLNLKAKRTGNDCESPAESLVDPLHPSRLFTHSGEFPPLFTSRKKGTLPVGN